MFKKNTYIYTGSYSFFKLGLVPVVGPAQET